MDEGKKVPGLTWKRLLVHLQGKEYIKTSYIATELGRPKAEMSKRIDTLRRWGYLRFVHRSMKGYGGYELTEKGKSFVIREEE